MAGSYGTPTGDNDLQAGIRSVLDDDRTILRAAERLSNVARPVVDGLATGLDHVNLDRGLVLRALCRRAQDNFDVVLLLVEQGRPAHARPHLRGMTEDLIFSRWLATLDAALAETVILQRMSVEVLQSAEAQLAFLPRAYLEMGVDDFHGAPGLELRPEQVTAELQRIQVEQRRLHRELGWPKYGLSVRTMAAEAGLEWAYNFFYQSSSRTVHASMHEVARMVWTQGRPPTWTISNETLRVFFDDFALTYATWLFSEAMHAQVDFFDELAQMVETDEWAVWLALVLEGMARNKRLPPLVTYEEMRPPRERQSRT